MKDTHKNDAIRVAREDPGKASLRFEWRRKCFHLSSLYIPFLYAFLSKKTALIILIPVSILFFLSDVLRFIHQGWNRHFIRIFKGLMREGEERRLVGTISAADLVKEMRGARWFWHVG